MPSGSEKDVLRIVAEEGGEATLGRLIRSFPCYSGQYTRCVVRSMATHDYLDWLATGKIILTDKGRKAIGMTEEKFQALIDEKEKKEEEARKIAIRRFSPAMVGSELATLRKVHELGKATKEALSREMDISTARAAFLLNALIKRDYVTGSHREGYQLTPEGRSFLAGEPLTPRAASVARPLIPIRR